MFKIGSSKNVKKATKGPFDTQSQPSSDLP